MFEKCGMKVTDHTIGDEIYSYVVQSNDDFHEEMGKIPNSVWRTATADITKTFPKKLLEQMKETANSIGITIEELLKLMVEDAYITELRSNMK